MPASALIKYQANLDRISLQDLVSADLRLSLHTSSYTPSAGTGGHHSASSLTNELSTANGYTAGGFQLQSVAVQAVSGGWKIESDPAVWNASGGSIPAWRYGVLRVNGTLWGRTNPVIGYFVGDDAPADVPATIDGNPLTVNCPANGWFDLIDANA